MGERLETRRQETKENKKTMESLKNDQELLDKEYSQFFELESLMGQVDDEVAASIADVGAVRDTENDRLRTEKDEAGISRSELRKNILQEINKLESGLNGLKQMEGTQFGGSARDAIHTYETQIAQWQQLLDELMDEGGGFSASLIGGFEGGFDQPASRELNDRYISMVQANSVNEQSNGLFSRLISKENQSAAQHAQAVAARLLKPSNESVKDLYIEYANDIKISDNNYSGTAHYSPSSHSISYNAKADVNNPTGASSTYFHETGHYIDDTAGNGHAWLSSDPNYKISLEKDVNTYIEKTIASNNCSQKEAFDIISQEIEGGDMSGVSDIFGSLTGCRCQGDWGHSPSYWKSDETNAAKEAFANMFEASIGNQQKEANMRKYFPTAYRQFESIIRRR